MKLFETKVAKRITITKGIGFIFGLSGFILLPMVFDKTTMMLRFALLLWYTTLGGLIGLFGYMDKHPIFTKWKITWWFRGALLGGWMNFVLALFIYNNLIVLMQGTFYEGFSPFWIILEGMIIGIIMDYFGTKFGGEGKELIKSKFF